MKNKLIASNIFMSFFILFMGAINNVYEMISSKITYKQFSNQVLMKVLLCIFITFFVVLGSGCAAVQRAGEGVFNTSDKAIEIVQQGRDRIDATGADLIENRLEEWKDQASFGNEVGREVDNLFRFTLEARVSRMVEIALYLCSNSEAKRLLFQRDLRELRISCNILPRAISTEAVEGQEVDVPGIEIGTVEDPFSNE